MVGGVSQLTIVTSVTIGWVLTALGAWGVVSESVTGIMKITSTAAQFVDFVHMYSLISGIYVAFHHQSLGFVS